MGELQTATSIMADRGLVRRDEFAGQQVQTQAETSMAAVAAREQAMVQARFIMAERHQRNWDVIRVRLLSHCDRPGFAEKAWYKKPTGRAKVNGQWVETFAEDLSARFMEVARQEIGNLDTDTSVSYEDENVRIVKAFVLDIERNNRDSRDIIVPKVTEKRGKQNKAGDWEPPEGREIISQRLNTYGEPVYLCRATEDEVRLRVNSEISKAQRDETKRLIPADILQDCRDRIAVTKQKEDKRDPLSARKKVIDSFASIHVMPDELVTYIGCSLEKASPAQMDELRGLFSAIKDGEITMGEALRKKYDGEGTPEDQSDVARKKIVDLKKEEKKEEKPKSTEPTQEEMDAATKAQLAKENGEQEQPQRGRRNLFGGGDK